MSDLGFYVANALSGGLQGYAKGAKDRRDEEIEKARLRELVNASMMKEKEAGFRRDGAGAVDFDPAYYTEGTPSYQRSNREMELKRLASGSATNRRMKAGQAEDLRKGFSTGTALTPEQREYEIDPGLVNLISPPKPMAGARADVLRAQGHQIDANIPDDYIFPTGALPYLTPGQSPPAQRAATIQNQNLKNAADIAQKEKDRLSQEQRAKDAIASREKLAKAALDAKGKGLKKEKSLDMAKKTATVIDDDVNRAFAIMDGSEWAVGPWAGRTRAIPGTPAYDLNNLLDTIRANVSFDKLQAMREASPTGAALGPVSDFENKLLQSTLGKLDVTMDPEQFRYNLKRLQDQYRKVLLEGIAPGSEGDEAPEPKKNASQKRAAAKNGGSHAPDSYFQTGKAKTVTKKQYSPSRNQTKIIYSDGTEEIQSGKK